MRGKLVALSASLLLTAGVLAGLGSAEESGWSSQGDATCDDLARQQDQERRAFSEEQNGRRQRHYAEQAQEHDAFASSNHSQAEWENFSRQQNAENEAFERGLQQESEALNQRLMREWDEKCGRPEDHPYPSGSPSPAPSYTSDPTPYPTASNTSYLMPEDGAEPKAHPCAMSASNEVREDCDHPYPTPTGDPRGDRRSDPCHEKREALEQIFHELESKWRSRHEAFASEFEAAREAFMQEEHTEDEWRAFGQKWHERAEAQFAEFRADLVRLAEERGVRDCVERAGEHREGPKPIYGEAPRRHGEDRAYGPPMPPPGELHEEDREIRALREKCEARARAIMDEHRPTTASNDSYPRQWVSEEKYRELKERMMEIQRECEKEIRALYEQRHGGQPEGDFKHDFGSFAMYWDEALGRIVVKGRFLTLQGIPEVQAMTQITVNGQLFVDRLFVTGYLSDFRPEQTEDGTALRIYDSNGDRVLELHDNPRGVINLATSTGISAVTLDLADYLSLEKTDEGLRVSDGSIEGALLVHGGEVEVSDGNVLKIKGKATFLVTTATIDARPIEAAILEKKVGAEVIVDAEGDGLKTAATPYGDLEIAVAKEDEGKISCRVESASGVGKTVVFRLDGSLFGSNELVIRAAAIEDGVEMALEAREADSLEDALDPLNDGDVVEYWVVLDKRGVQVIVSFPHFSEKKVTIESAEDANVLPVPGFEGVVALAAIAAVSVVVGLRARKQP